MVVVPTLPPMTEWHRALPTPNPWGLGALGVLRCGPGQSQDRSGGPVCQDHYSM